MDTCIYHPFHTLFVGLQCVFDTFKWDSVYFERLIEIVSHRVLQNCHLSKAIETDARA